MLYSTKGRKGKNVITTAASPLKPNQRLYIFDSTAKEIKPKNSSLKGPLNTVTQDKVTGNGSIVRSNGQILKWTLQTDNKSSNTNSSVLRPAVSAEKSDNCGVNDTDNTKGL